MRRLVTPPPINQPKKKVEVKRGRIRLPLKREGRGGKKNSSTKQT